MMLSLFQAHSRPRLCPALRLGVLAWATAALLFASPLSAQSPVRSQWKGVGRVIAFADVHGAYDELTTLLREAGVVDAQHRWVAGRTHVASLGDLLDRGADSRKVMDLLIRLQGEATAAGGALHVVVGNHEAMNVLGDLRYVARDEYASYADLEPDDMRTKFRAAWEAQKGAGTGAAFDERFPPGYFGHRAALGPQGRYGRWILGLPVAVVVDGTLFMHAGPSALLQGMGIDELNTRYRTALADYLQRAATLEQAGLLRPGDEFDARPRIAAQRLAALGTADAPPPPELDAAVKAFTQADQHPLLSRDGPNWYRGAALCREASETDVLAPLLRQFGVSRVVVGHTPTRNRRALTRFDGRVVKLDTGMNHAAFKGRGAALFIDGDVLSVRYAGEPAAAALEPEPLHVAPSRVDDASVAAALANGAVTVAGPRRPGEWNVVVEHRGLRVPGVFLARPEEAARRELAAYRLDRHLGLGIVPATARREVQGMSGVVQARPEKWVTQAEVQQQSLRGGGWCALEPQFQLVYAFDVLTGNDARSPDTLFFDAEEWVAFVTANDRAFGRGKRLPAYLAARPPRPGPELRHRLAMLDEQSLAGVLGDLVDAKARRAILDRRDLLADLPAEIGDIHLFPGGNR